MSAKLYVVHGSHPCATVQRALDMKAVPYEVVELLPPLHARSAAPALRHAHGARVDARVRREARRARGPSCGAWRSWRRSPRSPGRPRRARRRRARGGVGRRGVAADGAAPAVDDPRHGAPRHGQLPGRLAAAAPPHARGAGAGPARRRASSAASTARRRAPSAPTCARCPATSTASTAGSADGVLGGETVNAADLQIATTSRLMLTIGDVRPFFAGRPAEAHAMALFGEWAGSTPAGRVPGGVAVAQVAAARPELHHRGRAS